MAIIGFDVYYCSTSWSDESKMQLKVLPSNECSLLLPRLPASTVASWLKKSDHGLRYDTRCYFNVRSKADMSQLNLPHRNNN